MQRQAPAYFKVDQGRYNSKIHTNFKYAELLHQVSDILCTITYLTHTVKHVHRPTAHCFARVACQSTKTTRGQSSQSQEDLKIWGMTQPALPMRARINITQVWRFLLDLALPATSNILVFLIFLEDGRSIFTEQQVEVLAKLFYREKKSNIAEAAFM